jgi:hypothetical protein
MLKSIEGIYRNGKIELTELPGGIDNETPVIVTFLEHKIVDLETYGISQAQASKLRERLATFSEDWDNPEMDIYDDYDANKAKL